MGSMCRHSARELDPDYICFSVINNRYQLSGGKTNQKEKTLQSLEDMPSLMFVQIPVNSLWYLLMPREQHFIITVIKHKNTQLE